jgi:uncharacterized protein YyaL (SSP411 family)
MSNRLSDETSPYLLQHAENPVDWHPWGEDAFALARDSGKPVLLSVGYSACHWCHVMAHESFEDEGTAELMNELFVNIKVDREERPDVDKIYQTAHQLLMQQRGGWPLTMFLNAEDQRPFFGGTYFPNEPRYGMPAFGDLLTKVASYYSERMDEVRKQGQKLSDILGQLDPPAASAENALTPRPIEEVRQQLAASFDKEFGGHGGAPKFPHPGTMEWLLRTWRRSANDAEPDLEALFMATLTLTRMAEGGIYDHIGGGFCRYSVDRYWQIPHFEKMLYDNGPLLAIYAQTLQATGEKLFEKVANQTADWMLADMRSPQGGFYSSRDADSEGDEGKFYVWTPDEVAALLEPSDYALFSRKYGLDKEANFEGKWHLTVREDVDDPDGVIDNARLTLLEVRSGRVAPGRDEKQLTSWNALAIRGLTIAGRILERVDLIDAAESAITAIRRNVFRAGRLLASYKDGDARFPAYLDDHAFLLDALLEHLQSRWDSENLEFAVQLADLLLEHFEDKQGGGFYFTADDHETLMHRPKPLADDAMPSGNGTAAYALQRLGHLIGEAKYTDAAERTLRCAWKAMDEYPHGHVTLLMALEEFLTPPEVIVIRGASDEINRWRDSAAKLYAPSRLIFSIGANEQDLPGLLAERKAIAGETVAYRCVGTRCELPVTTWEALAGELGS